MLWLILLGFLICFLINLATHQVPNSLFSVVQLITVIDSPGQNFKAQPDAFSGQPYCRSYFVTGLKAGNFKTLENTCMEHFKC